MCRAFLREILSCPTSRLSTQVRPTTTLQPALRGVSVSIRRGEFIVILGKSGGWVMLYALRFRGYPTSQFVRARPVSIIVSRRGKTSLLNCIGTIDKPTRGDIFVCGTRIDARTSDAELADIRLRRLGFVFQQVGRAPRPLCPADPLAPLPPPPVQLAPWPDRARERRAPYGTRRHRHARLAAQACARPALAGRDRGACASRPLAAQRRRAAACDHCEVS